MERVLVINAHPRVRSEKSLSLQVLEHFVSKYAAQNPASLIEQIDLYREDVPAIDASLLNGWEKLESGEPLTEGEERVMGRMAEILQQFKGASKYVIAMPLHNFNIPSKLKDYMDNIIVPKETFRYTESGSEGLLTDGRSVVVIQGSDGIYTENDGYREVEYSHKYLKSMFEFLGITDYEIIRAQGRAMLDVKDILDTSRLAAAEVVERWSSK
ncbi:NAD(P)H-dependent oxidoreductase [Virgibacillus sp. LDC1]|uniref:FMN-dependent NADH-azoreductase n=1 Tax=Paenibacillus TaxID=44249 RepID=UPI000C278422|nr:MULTISPECIES: NAD(P)H-dependent oxidoreductase [Paenibacillus]MCV4235703.1 NAD(P)H-dependent oxidoreductase [Virgibacillus sp. LDC1]MEC0259556.1 NAD(P)H-dependent oxidoreductase [Paenibacillus lautus]MEC0309520.1 NAD(P)H-dependent oxidoreductase [Paenibacillus lautus]PJN48604.1 FMN-dependent NADH-azoreductase 1 [Paenibacillus sp. GM2FR]